jgi:Domain of unknown function (DUF4126)
MENYLALIPALLLGVALSAASGFRIFIPLLVSNLATKFGIFSLASNFAWMGSTTTTVVLSIAVLAELAAYYVPVVDNLLDSIAAPVAVGAGTLLTTSFLKIDDPVLQWGLGLVAGGGVAGTIQAGTSLLRLGSTKFTGGLGNATFSTLENGISLFISLISVWLPVFMGISALLFVVWILRKLIRQFRKKAHSDNPNTV